MFGVLIEEFIIQVKFFNVYSTYCLWEEEFLFVLVGVWYLCPGICALTEISCFRRDFDIERARETEEYEKSRSLGVSNRKNNSNAEAK